MENVKQKNWKPLEIVIFSSIIAILIINSIIKGDWWVALVEAICGITYTFLAGKGTPVCYIFGVVASSLYSFLSFTQHLWANLILYAAYYIPMQILGFFKWSKNLKSGSREIVKIKLSTKERLVLALISFVLICALIPFMYYFKDTHPILDSITTILSVLGMYLTVRRAVEQWFVWIIVNALSFLMWFFVLMAGTKVFPTVLKWAIYLVVSIYFYIEWQKDLNAKKAPKV